MALAIGIPVGLLVTTHLKSLPFAYTVRSWFLLRALIKKAKENNLQPDGKMMMMVIKYCHEY